MIDNIDGQDLYNDSNQLNDIDSEELDNKQDIYEGEDFDEVLKLTEYDGNLDIQDRNLSVIAKYDNIDSLTINKKCEIQAKNFIDKVTKFVMELNDDVLTLDHKKYLKDVAVLQIADLKDMLSLVDINRLMLGNIVERINATQLDDYAIINTYNMMVNQHIKLIKELQNQYRNIPSVMKRMRADVITDQVLNDKSSTDEVFTQDYGDKQFNSHKQLLQSILEKNGKNI